MTKQDLSRLNVVCLVALLVLGVLTYMTASQVFAILCIVPLVIGALNITGVIGSIFRIDE